MSIGDYVAMAVAEAIHLNPQAKAALTNEAITPGPRRTTIKTAIIMSFPGEG